MSDRSLNQTLLFKILCVFVLSLVVFISVLNTVPAVAMAAFLICLISGVITAVVLYFEVQKFRQSW